MDLTREERIMAAAIIMRDAVEEMLAHDCSLVPMNAASTQATTSSSR